MITKDRVGAKVFIDFLIRLIHNAKKPIFMVVDGHPAHRAKKVSQFVDSVKDRLRLFFLPPYSPELNPDEWVWNHLKKQWHRPPSRHHQAPNETRRDFSHEEAAKVSAVGVQLLPS
jgi:transposase